MSAPSVLRLKPLEYIHVLDHNTNVTRVVSGPTTFTRQEHEVVLTKIMDMVKVPPRSYVVVDNPVAVDADGAVRVDKNRNYVLRHGDQEIRFHRAPFPLYPGERLSGQVTALRVVPPDSALRLRCTRPCDGREAGDEWLWRGPGTYMPRVEEEVLAEVHATVVKPNEAVRVRAVRQFDKGGVTRVTGEEWLERGGGAYLPDVNEEVVRVVRPLVLTDRRACHVRAVRTFEDSRGVAHKAGSEWLVTAAETDLYLPDVNEEVVRDDVPSWLLSAREYCVVVDPVGDDGVPQLGCRKQLRGPLTFFLRPGESVPDGVQTVPILAADEALLFRAREEFVDADGTRRRPGDRWMVRGETECICPLEAEVLERRRLIALDTNEGVYVRDVETGRVRMHVGSSYMLTANEELWEKDLPAEVEHLLAEYSPTADGGPRDRTRVVSLRAPNNTAVQIYDYKQKVSRVVFGPGLILLGPDEHFTLLSLSGDTPKRPHVVKDLCLLLGPAFSTDRLVVETSDHARLQLRLSYNWYFDVKTDDAKPKMFGVPDFVGDFCKAVASNVRGAVAQASFDEFHRSSARMIRAAIFGVDGEGKVKDKLEFAANGLVVTNVDIQSVEPVDQRTRDSLQKSVQQAIEITTKSQEAAARHAARREEAQSAGLLERQRIADKAMGEKARAKLVERETSCARLEATGQALAEAYGAAEAAKVHGRTSVELAQLKSKLVEIQARVEFDALNLTEQIDVEHLSSLSDLAVRRSRELASIESAKFAKLVKAIGPDTLTAIARAGPEVQVKLLQSLGLESVIITDGNSPVNLFNTATTLVNKE